jgi:hypothetical protein
MSNYKTAKTANDGKASQVNSKKIALCHFLVTPKDASLGLSQRKITGASAAPPAIAKVLGSVTPAMYNAKTAATNDRAHEAARLLAWSISFFPLFWL